MMGDYDIIVLLAADQGFPMDADGYVDASSPNEQDVPAYETGMEAYER